MTILLRDERRCRLLDVPPVYCYISWLMIMDFDLLLIPKPCNVCVIRSVIFWVEADLKHTSIMCII